ncbi:hypothetical protein LN473_22225, partial [Xanthomonas vesicatoria]|nr:hypothetical protein [Xanthomonas vesicatoria]
MNPSMGLDGGIHAANGPTSGEDTTPDSSLVFLLKKAKTPRCAIRSCWLLCRNPGHRSTLPVLAR